MNVHEMILSVMQNIEYRVRPDKIQSILDKWREALNLDDIITYELSDSGLIMDILHPNLMVMLCIRMFLL